MKEKNLQRKINLLIVDDHPIVREGLKQIIQQDSKLVVCGEADSYATALIEADKNTPDIAIVDVTLNKSNGIDLIREFKSRFPRTKILVLSIHDEMIYAERALRAGADGYIMKHQAMINILDGLYKVLKGELCVSDSVTQRLVQKVTKRYGSEKDAIATLSNRELQIFYLYGQGLKTRSIAEELQLSIKTIESHREHILEKLNLENSSELVRYAVEFVVQNSSQ